MYMYDNMSLFISRFKCCNSTSKRQTSIILGLDPKGPCGQSELLRLSHWQELNPRPANLEAGKLTPRPNCSDIPLPDDPRVIYFMISAIRRLIRKNGQLLQLLEGELSWSYPFIIKGHITPTN